MKNTTFEHLYEKWIQILVLKSPKSMVLVPSSQIRAHRQGGQVEGLVEQSNAWGRQP